MKAVTGPTKVAIETEDLWVVDDLAYETGKYSYTFTPAGEKETKSDGHYVTSWKKQGGFSDAEIRLVLYAISQPAIPQRRPAR